MDFYGNALIASGAFLEENPDAVAAFNRAVTRGLKDVLADPAGAVELVAKYDPLIDKELEQRRLHMAIEQNIVTPYVQENGFGAIDEARMARAIDQLAAALDLPTKPAVADIWTDAFLPPAEERDLTN
jgi:NitT/TauT family transport system substrate-binding protein